MNIFSYVFGESIDFVSILDEWSLKAQEYINTYFEGERLRAIAIESLTNKVIL